MDKNALVSVNEGLGLLRPVFCALSVLFSIACAVFIARRNKGGTSAGFTLLMVVMSLGAFSALVSCLVSLHLRWQLVVAPAEVRVVLLVAQSVVEYINVILAPMAIVLIVSRHLPARGSAADAPGGPLG